jgi:hypothetical protein
MAWGKAAPKAAPPPPAFHHNPPSPSTGGPVIDATTVTSLLAVVALLAAAYGASIRFLPKSASVKTRVLFVWHLFDALIHLVFEGSFLYNCFFVSYSLPTSFSSSSQQALSNIRIFTPPDVYWLGQKDKLYGANYGTGVWSRLWQEYAKADHRWGGVDLGVVSLECLTVGLGAPLALWVCWLLRGEEKKVGLKRWFWMVVLATAELYGGESLFLIPYIYQTEAGGAREIGIGFHEMICGDFGVRV